MACTKALGQERTHYLWGSLRNCYMATGVLVKKAGACALQGFGGSSVSCLKVQRKKPMRSHNLGGGVWCDTSYIWGRFIRQRLGTGDLFWSTWTDSGRRERLWWRQGEEDGCGEHPLRIGQAWIWGLRERDAWVSWGTGEKHGPVTEMEESGGGAGLFLLGRGGPCWNFL